MVLAYYGMIMSFLSGGFRIVTVQSLTEGMFKTDVLNARRSMSSAQAAFSSSKGGGYGFAEKEHEHLFNVYATQLVEKEHSRCHSLLRNDKSQIIQPSQSTALSTPL
ncbi:hypothetical protein Tco_0780502 [Tanacetum coccineum]